MDIIFRDIISGIYLKLLESPTSSFYFVNPPYLVDGEALTKVLGAKIEKTKVIFILDDGLRSYEASEENMALFEVIAIYEDLNNCELVDKFTLSPFYETSQEQPEV